MPLELDQWRDRDLERDDAEWEGEITPSGGLESGRGGEGDGVREECALDGPEAGRTGRMGRGDTLRPAMYCPIGRMWLYVSKWSVRSTKTKEDNSPPGRAADFVHPFLLRLGNASLI